MIFSYYNISINLGFEFSIYFLTDSQYERDELSNDIKDMSSGDKKKSEKLPYCIKYRCFKNNLGYT